MSAGTMTVARLSELGSEELARVLRQVGPAERAWLSRQIDRELERRTPTLPATVPLRDGTIGRCVRWPRTDDCWTAALATCLQRRIEDVPDARIDERLAQGEAPAEISRSYSQTLDQWLRARRLRMVVHPSPPADCERWIGIIPLQGWFNSHSVVMTGSEILFDPVAAENTETRPIRIFEDREIQSGVSFETTTTKRRGR